MIAARTTSTSAISQADRNTSAAKPISAITNKAINTRMVGERGGWVMNSSCEWRCANDDLYTASARRAGSAVG
ncbi:hypothetical protein ASE10_16475 [Lysobacter sp. Root76]|nr:hypothetical protein ASE10_16475 [Lysobacter sp. Root76]KRD67604.1 hypothetical protein ASE45_12650 [Lysobacter sp. Root96]